MLNLLNELLDDQVVMKTVIKKLNLNTANLFHTTALTVLNNEIEHNEQLVQEALVFLDVVNLYSFLEYNDSSTFIDQIKKSMCSLRTFPSANLVLGKEIVDSYTFDTPENLLNFLHSNPTLLGLYVYLVVSQALQKT